MRRTTIRLELTKAQKEQIQAATGREVNVLELRLPGGPEAASPLRSCPGSARPETEVPGRPASRPRP